MQSPALGAKHPETLTSANNLAAALCYEGKNEEAAHLQKKDWVVLKRVLGAEHPHAFSSVNKGSSTFWNQGKYEEAARLQQDVLEVRRRALPMTAESANRVASMFRDCARQEEANVFQKYTYLRPGVPRHLYFSGSLQLIGGEAAALQRLMMMRRAGSSEMQLGPFAQLARSARGFAGDLIMSHCGISLLTFQLLNLIVGATLYRLRKGADVSLENCNFHCVSVSCGLTLFQIQISRPS